MAAPLILSSSSNKISVNLPNLDELSFLTVLALPNASNNGFVSKTCFSTPLVPSSCFAECAKYCMMCFAVSVFPAPDSPETKID